MLIIKVEGLRYISLLKFCSILIFLKTLVNARTEIGSSTSDSTLRRKQPIDIVLLIWFDKLFWRIRGLRRADLVIILFFLNDTTSSRTCYTWIIANWTMCLSRARACLIEWLNSRPCLYCLILRIISGLFRHVLCTFIDCTEHWFFRLANLGLLIRGSGTFKIAR